MTLADQVSALATRIGTEFKTIRTEIGTAGTNARNRANHTGTQLAATISDFATAAVAANASAVDAVKARSTHTGTQSADTITDGTTNKVLTAAMASKLGGIATGATANQTDTFLRSRANHTGTQTASTISDFSTAAASAAGPAIDAKVGNLSTLTTTAKTTAVAAINELKASIASAAGINDGQVAATTTWSSTKITSHVTAAITAVVDGAPAAFDTLKEIADYIASDQTATSGILTSLGLRVRVDEAQTFNATQQARGRLNIGAVASADIGNTETDFVAVFEAALAA